jgi:beta-lactamase regulating signal transducer with metallopeptidase domain/tetratricopeptide (TPR) repeat protein
METLAHTGLTGLAIVLKATALLAAGFLALRLVPRASASARHLAALLALVGAALVPALAPVLPRWEWRILPAKDVRAAEPSPAAPAKSRVTRVEPTAARPPRRDPVLAEKLGPSGVVLPAEAAPAKRRPLTSRDLYAGAALLWAFGAASMFTQLVAGLLTVRRLVREARPLEDPAWTSEALEASRSLGLARPAALLVSERTDVPLTAGVVSPVLVLPPAAESWDSGRRRVVLLHELAHVRRRDTLARLVAEFVAALYWFHPLAHALVRSVLREGERAADDLVLSSGTRPSEYASHLVGIVRGLARKPERWALAMARPSQVEERVRAILDPAIGRVPVRAFQAALWAAVLVVLSVPLSAVRLGRADASMIEPPANVSVGIGPASRFEEDLFAGSATGGATGGAWGGGAGGATGGVRGSGSAGVGGGVALASRTTVLASPKKDSGSEWYQRGMKNHRAERYDDAIAAFQKAIELGYREDASAYNIACGYALKGDADHAFEWLKKAAGYGFDVEGYLHDDDLDSLHADPRWKDLKKDVRAAKKDAKKAEGDRAVARYDRLVASGSKDGASLYRTGMDLLNAGRYDASEKAFRASAAAGNRAGASLYNAACAQSRAGNKAGALATLRQALEAGYDDPNHMSKDDDLEDLHGEKGFTEVLDLADDLKLDAGAEGYMGTFLPHTSRSAWRAEIPRYEKVAKAHPELGRVWFNLGYAQLMGDRPEAAAVSLGKALERGYRKSTTLYNLACAEARSGNTDKAFERLNAAIDAGFDSPSKIRHDSDLDSLHQDARFQKALERAGAHEDADADADDDAD